MSPVLSELLLSGFTISSSLRRRTHLVQSLSVVFLYCGNSSQIHHSGSEEDLVGLRKRKRMQSNRESARRSRVRKQKHLDDLTDQINQMKKDNTQILTTIDVTTQQFVQVEAENSVIRAQMGELSQRLDYLNEIINLINCSSSTTTAPGLFEFEQPDFMNNPWNLMYLNQQPIMASAEMLQY
ncbi:Basic-leucine zipper domain-containing protein [Cynara cardunculus var. scolymus]|uniref:Basic-leucine zipper domain-containing protein n=1 Tax=Cynara cardunculus var. scolymus TaxID=59895 RepID=A0A103YCF2_CYNCS|nr:Basic-leucine zipper domain-containing protein [Cynara cardunculus var. scolymus]